MREGGKAAAGGYSEVDFFFLMDSRLIAACTVTGINNDEKMMMMKMRCRSSVLTMRCGVFTVVTWMVLVHQMTFVSWLSLACLSHLNIFFLLGIVIVVLLSPHMSLASFSGSYQIQKYLIS